MRGGHVEPETGHQLDHEGQQERQAFLCPALADAKQTANDGGLRVAFAPRALIPQRIEIAPESVDLAAQLLALIRRSQLFLQLEIPVAEIRVAGRPS